MASFYFNFIFIITTNFQNIIITIIIIIITTTTTSIIYSFINFIILNVNSIFVKYLEVIKLLYQIYCFK